MQILNYNIDGVLANPQLFPHPEVTRSIYGCLQVGTVRLQQLTFQAYDMEGAGFEYVDPGSEALGAAAAGAHDKGEGFFGYYWGPTRFLVQEIS